MPTEDIIKYVKMAMDLAIEVKAPGMASWQQCAKPNMDWTIIN